MPCSYILATKLIGIPASPSDSFLKSLDLKTTEICSVPHDKNLGFSTTFCLLQMLRLQVVLYLSDSCFPDTEVCFLGGLHSA